MNEVGGFVTIFTILALVTTGFVVGLPSKRHKGINGSNFFAFLCITLAVWVGANFASDLDPERSIWWIRLGYISITTALFSFLMFVNRFPVVRFISKRENIIHTILLGVIVLLSCTDYFIPRVEFVGGVSNVVPGPLYYLFLPYFFYTISMALYRLAQGQRALKGRNRTQVIYIQLGIGAMALVAGTTNLILPLLTGNNQLYSLGSASTLLFVGLIAYSIVKHRLFDIRRAAIRTLAYILAIVVLLTLYGLVVMSGLLRFTVLGDVPVQRQAILLIIAGAVGVSMPMLVGFFDKATRKIFFRNVYDPQEVLSRLGEIVEVETSTATFSLKAMELLEDSIKPEFISLALSSEDDLEIHKFNRGISKAVFEELLERHQDIVIAGDVGDEKTQALFGKNDIAIGISLATSRRRFGYIVIGYKQNGGDYSIDDIEFLRLFCDELGLALQNLLRLKEIKAFSNTLQAKVDAATGELRSSNRKLKSLDASKDEFISMASHQLRTPLTSVKGYISMVLDGDMGEITPQQRKVLEEAFASSQRMVFLIGDFLNVSRLQTGKFELELSMAKLPFLIEQEIEQLRATASSRGIKLAYDPPENFPDIELDENKIRQVMMNFIDNAIYYSPADTTITISLVKHPHHITFKVSDQGIGVPKSEQAKLFTKFYRATNAKLQRPDGTGIGLYMAKKVIVAHGGNVIFETAEGKGSTFGFRLPFSSTGLRND